ncbi:MAG: cobalamin-independent methionine synthase II family protein [Alphaproteobacteria bacterium]|nr:cobalamin-independent methionine synthase II family protein [Alphaproteobacteria bacterium]
MYKATAGKPLAATITGSLPRPSWFVENLSGRPFLSAMAGDVRFREQYADAVAALIADQQRAGIDIVSDGEMRFDLDVGGRSWFGYQFDRMDGMERAEVRRGGAEWAARGGARRRTDTPGDILHEVAETRMPPLLTGRAGCGCLQYDAVWKTAQRLTDRPVKMGSCSAQMVDKLVVNKFYKDRRESVMALSDAMNEEHLRLADAGCAVIQVEEPCLHFVAGTDWEVSLDTYVEAFNREVRGLRAKTEVWCHTCWGNPLAQRVEAGYAYKPILPYLDRLDVDVLTFEAADSGGRELPEIAAAVSQDKKICIGVVSHRTLQVEQPSEVAALIRKALKHVRPERLLLSTDCGFGRQGMARIHAFYKMTSLVLGANIVRRELGLPEAPVRAAEDRFSFL